MAEIKDQWVFYHGAKHAFSKFQGDVIFLASNKDAIMPWTRVQYGRPGEPRILTVKAKPGKIKDIDEIIKQAVRGRTFNTVLKREIAQAREEGYRYLTYLHRTAPGKGWMKQGRFKETVSLYPSEDLQITDVQILDHEVVDLSFLNLKRD